MGTLTAVESRGQQARQENGAHPAAALAGKRPGQPENQWMRLPAMFGNQGTLKLLAGGILQRKLTVNQPGDAFEQEADRMADAVMRMAAPVAGPVSVGQSGVGSRLQRCSCGSPAAAGGECEECKAMRLQRSPASPSGATTAPPIVHHVLNSPGQPLDAATRNFMESSLGHDFSGVRVHTGARAAESARAVDALAYTVGNKIVFNEGRYAPGAESGRRILAHELTHVVQQGSAAPRSVSPAFRERPSTEKPVMRVAAGLQRQACTVGSAPGMACADAQASGHPPGVNVEHFVVNQSGLLPAHVAAIDAFQRSWVAHGSRDAVQVHGYASCEGAANDNVQLSCDRATTVSTNLTGRGIVNTVFAHGETNEFGPGLDANRRVIIQGVDLVAANLAGSAELEGALHNRLVIRQGSPLAAAVRLIQQSLLDQGYTLPGFGVDGLFGPETEATLRLFQTDAGTTVKGVVDAETMAALDFHDPSNRTGPGPVAKTGPLPGPRPAPARGCDFPYAGVTFALAHAAGAGVSPAAAIGLGMRLNAAGATALVAGANGLHPATYTPDVTITAPNDARASEFQVGFISNVLSTDRNFNFTGGHRIHTQVTPIPIKDGVPVSSGHYHAIFVSDPSPGVLQDFAANNTTVNLVWPDTPGDAAFVNLLDNPSCGGALTPQTLTGFNMHDEFRTWVAVRHRPSGCVRTLHHVDWNLVWSATLAAGAPLPTVTPTSNVINVTQANGDGSPAFIQGGPVPADVATPLCT